MSKKHDIDLEELSDCFHAYQDEPAALNGFGCFTSDSMHGVGAFCFCSSVDEWKELFPAIVFIEALIDKDLEIYSPEDLKQLCKILEEFNDSKWAPNDFQKFVSLRNGLLLDYDIDFAGTVDSLFRKESGFSEKLINQYGSDPQDDKAEYINYLNNYIQL